MLHHLIVASLALASACGPALPDGASHPASADAVEAPVPSLATALTDDPAPPPEAVGAAARSFALDGDRGVDPPVLGIAARTGGAAPPSRDPTARDEEHEGHASQEQREEEDEAEDEHAHHH